jgi:hypothetical protein
VKCFGPGLKILKKKNKKRKKSLEGGQEQQHKNKKNKVFIGVRKRPWGKFMAKIRDSTHKGVCVT